MINHCKAIRILDFLFEIFYNLSTYLQYSSFFYKIISFSMRSRLRNTGAEGLIISGRRIAKVFILENPKILVTEGDKISQVKGQNNCKL